MRIPVYPWKALCAAWMRCCSFQRFVMWLCSCLCMLVCVCVWVCVYVKVTQCQAVWQSQSLGRPARLRQRQRLTWPTKPDSLTPRLPSLPLLMSPWRQKLWFCVALVVDVYVAWALCKSPHNRNTKASTRAVPRNLHVFFYSLSLLLSLSPFGR